MADEIKITGLENVKNVLRLLPERIEKNILTAGVRAGANVVKDDAVQRLGGRAKKKDIVVQKRRTPKGQIKFSVGPSKDRWYLRFLEFGANPHSIKSKKILADNGVIFGKEVNHPGVKANPFLRPAIDENAGKILQEMGDKMGQRIEKEAQKLGHK